MQKRIQFNPLRGAETTKIMQTSQSGAFYHKIVRTSSCGKAA